MAIWTLVLNDIRFIPVLLAIQASKFMPEILSVADYRSQAEGL
jgi:hypothetical protein